MSIWEWLCINWHWAEIIGAIVTLIVFGWVVVGVDDSGDIWFF